MGKWKTVTINDVCQKITDGTHSTPKYTSIGIPFLSVKDITGKSISFENTRYISIEEHNELIKRCNPEFNDILYTKVGTTGVAKVIDVKKEFSIFVSLALLKPNKNIINSLYFEYVLNSPSVYQQAQEKTRGVANRNLVLKDIKEITFNLPIEIDEQLKIVDFLNNVISKLDKSIQLLEDNLNHSKALLLSIIDEEFKQLSKSVKSSTLPQLVKKDKHSIKRGPFGSALKKSFFVPTGYKIYEQKNAIKNDFSIGEYYINEEKFKELEAFEVKSGDIIISCSGTIGKIAIAPPEIEKGIINQALLKISLDKNKILPEYFSLFFENFVNQGELESKGAAIKNIVSVAELKQIPIPVPNTILEQQLFIENIVKKRDLINDYINETENKLNNLKALKSSLLDQAFKGEL